MPNHRDTSPSQKGNRGAESEGERGAGSVKKIGCWVKRDIRVMGQTNRGPEQSRMNRDWWHRVKEKSRVTKGSWPRQIT